MLQLNIFGVFVS